MLVLLSPWLTTMVSGPKFTMMDTLMTLPPMTPSFVLPFTIMMKDTRNAVGVARDQSRKQVLLPDQAMVLVQDGMLLKNSSSSYGAFPPSDWSGLFSSN